MSDVSITTRIDGAAESKRAIDGLVAGLQSLSSGGDNAGKSVASLGLKFTELNNALELAKKAWSTISGIASDFVKQAAEDEAQTARLKISVESAGYSFEAVGGQLEEFNKSMALMAGVADDEVSASLQRMIPLTKDVGSAMSATTLAVDIAKATHKDLAEVTNVVQLAMQGQYRGLKQLGITMGENATATEALAKLQERFGNAIEETANTYETASGRFKQSVETVEKSIGGLLLPTLTKALNSLSSFFKFFDGTHKDTIIAIAGALTILAGAAGIMALVANIGTLLPLVTGMATAFGAWAVAAGTLVLEFGAVVAAGLAVGFVFYELATNVKNIGDVFIGLGKEIGTTAKALWSAAKGDFKEAWHTIYVEGGKAADETDAAFGRIQKNITSDFNQIVNNVKRSWNDLTGMFSSAPSMPELVQNKRIEVKSQNDKGLTPETDLNETGFNPDKFKLDGPISSLNEFKLAIDGLNASAEQLSSNFTDSESAWSRPFISMREEAEASGEAIKNAVSSVMDTSKLAGSAVAESIDMAFQQLSKGIGDAVGQAVMFSADLGDAMKNLLKNIAANIISFLVQIGIQRGVTALLNLMFGALEASQALGNGLAQVYVNAYAATAAIPIVGPIIAPGVAAGALAGAFSGAMVAKTTGAALGSAADGMDTIPGSGSYTLHAGERVVNAKANTDLTDYLRSRRDERSMGGGGQSVVVQMQFGGPVIFDDIAEAEFIDRVGRGLRRASALGG